MALAITSLCTAGAWAQTNLIAGWDGGNNTGSPSNFGWTSSANRTLNARNASSGIRMTTNYSGYKLEDNTSYSYSSTSDPSSVIFWVRYNTSGESFTYTFKGLEPDSYYDFSGLVGWHNNQSAPNLTVALNDGTNTLATMSKTASTKLTLYAISSRFKTPSTITNTTDIKIVFTCNQTGDCMEAISALKLVKVDVVLKDDLEAAIAYATKVYNGTSNETLSAAITTAQNVYDDGSATQSDVNNALAELNAVVASVIATQNDLTFLISNPGFESTTAETTNWAAAASANSADYTSTGWKSNGGAGWSSSAVVAYGGSGQVNGASAPSVDNAGNGGNTLGISVGWDGLVTYQSSAITLPMGYYTLTVNGYNNLNGVTQFRSKNGFIPTSGTSQLSTKTSFTYGSWEEDVITFTLTETTEGVIQVGGQAVSGGSGSNAKVFFDNITLGYKSFATAWNEAKSEAQSVLDDATYATITGAERTTVTTSMSATPSTAAEYSTAITALENAVTAFTASLADYNVLDVEKTKASGLGMTAEAIAAVISTDNTAVVNTQNVKVAEYNYVSTNYAYGVALSDTWTSTGTNTSAATFNNEHWSGTTHDYKNQNDANGQGWNANSWDLDFNQNVTLPAGSYVFKVAGRRASGNNITMSLVVKQGETVLGTVSDFPQSNNSRGINKVGETAFEGESSAFANNGNGYGWEWRYVKFDLNALATVNIGVHAEATASQQWISFGDYTLQATNADVAALLTALADYDAALAAANTAKDDATYTNVQGLELTYLQAAIDADATLDKSSLSDVQTATSALTTNTASFTGAVSAYDAFAQAQAEPAMSKIMENVGDGVFQYNATTNDDLYAAYEAAKSAVDNFDVSSGTASAVQGYVNDLNGAIDDYNNQTLNAPATNKRYYLNIVDAGQSWNGYAVTFIAGGRSDMGGYTIQYLAPANVYMNQALKFTAVEGETNTYKVSAINVEDGRERYITTGDTYGGYTAQIRTTDDVNSALQIKINASTTANQFQLLNVSDGNNVIGRNATNPDNGMYTDGNNSFTIAEASQASVSGSLAAGKYATRIFPFTPELSSDITTYSCSAVDGATLTMTMVTEPAANTPYILYNTTENAIDISATGWGTASAATYDAGLLTGVYTKTNVPQDSYVLQTQGTAQAFYKVSGDFEATPYRCYLTVPVSSSVKAFFFDLGDADGITTVDNGQLTVDKEIYNLAGQRMNKVQKGVNIVNGKKVLVK